MDTIYPTSARKRVLLFGATGTIGQDTAKALIKKNYDVTCFLRATHQISEDSLNHKTSVLLDGACLRYGNINQYDSLLNDGFCHERFDVIISCLASRNGMSKDAWAIDYQAHQDILEIAKKLAIPQMILLSAICVQKPLLEFQKAKLAFEKSLIESGLNYSIVRPTAFFKSLSGQFERVRNGKSYLMFGDGMLTSCKPISNHDLSEFIVQCIDNSNCHRKILPIGGPGNAITPLEQGEKLFEILGLPQKYKKVPIGLMSAVIFLLEILGKVIPVLKDKAEFAKIGKYYATESMLVLNTQTGKYDADLTPSFGSETLYDFYKELHLGNTTAELREHRVF